MKKVKRYWFSTLAMLLAVIVFGQCLWGNAKQEVQIRSISVDEVSTLAYNEKAYEELKKFEEYEITSVGENDDELLFTGSRIFSVEELSDLDFVNESVCDEDIVVNYNLECDRETTAVKAEIAYKQNEELLNTEQLNITNIQYNEQTEEALIYFEDGSCVNTTDMYGEEIDNCSAAILAATASVAVVVSLVVVVVLVAVVVYYVLRWLFSWAKKSILEYRYERRVVQQKTYYYSPAITINGTRFETAAKTKEEIETLAKTKNGKPIYYLAFASGISYDGAAKDASIEPDGLFIGPAISYEIASSIMISPVYTTVERNGVDFNYVASIYSHNESSIINVLSQPHIGFASSTPISKPEAHNGGLYHYHPADKFSISIPFLKNGKEVTKKYRPHALFFNLDVTYWLAYNN